MSEDREEYREEYKTKTPMGQPDLEQRVMPDYVTEGDINMIDYFLLDRGDIERWSSWEKRKAVISREFPELIAAIDAASIAEKTLDRIARSIVDDAYKYPEA